MDEKTEAGCPPCDDRSNSDDRKPLQGTSLDNSTDYKTFYCVPTTEESELDGSRNSSEPPPPYLVALKEIEEEKKLRDRSRGSKNGTEWIDAVQNPDKVISEEHSQTVMQRLLEDHTVIQETQQMVVNIESRVDTLSKTLENAKELDQERWKEVVSQNALRVQEHQHLKTDINNLQEMMQGIQHMLVNGSGMIQAQAVTYDEMEGRRRSRSLSRDNSDRYQAHRNHSEDYSYNRESTKDWNGTKGLAGAAGGPQDDPNSADSSDSDVGDSEKRKVGASERRRREKNKRKISWSIDVEVWNICLKTEDEESFYKEAITLLEIHKIPNGDLLNKVCTRLGRKSKIVLEICNAICDYLKQKRGNIVEVWAGYWYKPDDALSNNQIVFAILTNDKQKIEDDNFAVYCRGFEEIEAQDENVAIMRKEREDALNSKELQNMKRVQRECSPVLMKKHKRLTRITVSWMKHTVGKSIPSDIRKCLCIALYVHIRGLIPLDEDPFESFIEGYPIDVREGIITLCKGPYEFHKHLKMGCAISSRKCAGTLGPFLKFQSLDNEQYALTSAHVLFQGDCLKQVVKEKNIEHFGNFSDVYQPPLNQAGEDHPFGKVVRTIYKKGSNGFAGMEIAVIKLYNRFPSSGKFPESKNYASAGFGPAKPFHFASGDTLPISELKASTEVFKYGCETGLTVGLCRTDGSSIRLRNLTAENVGFEMVMHGQIEVMPRDNVDFAKYGDSGALVMATSEKTNELAAVGIFEGQAADRTCYLVTPIPDILNELAIIERSVCYINKYPHCQTFSQTDLTDQSMDTTERDSVSVEAKVNEIDTKLEVKVSEIDRKLSAKVNEIDSRFARMEQTMEQHILLYKTEISKDLEQQSKTQSEDLKSHLSQLMMQLANSLNTNIRNPTN